MNWIKFSEKKPEDEQAVIVWQSDVPYACPAYFFKDDEEGFSWERRGKTQIEKEKVTHWMPMPSKPKE